VFVAAVVAPATLPAQNNAANITVMTTITPSLSVAAVKNLDFGTLPQGSAPRTINSADADAGQFSVIGLANANVLLTFALPTELSDGGSFSIPIDTWTGQASALGPGNQFFTPSASPATTVQIGTNGTMAVFVGARIAPSPNQAPGSYSAVVSMTVAYF
jgi:hypothetical protein